MCVAVRLPTHHHHGGRGGSGCAYLPEAWPGQIPSLLTLILIPQFTVNVAAHVGMSILRVQLEEKVPEDLKSRLRSDVLAINDNGTVQYSTFATLLMYSQYSVRKHYSS